MGRAKLNMPSVITHLAITDKVFDRFFSGKEKSDFLVGTLFPDIRYLAGLEREKTHLSEVKLTDCREDLSFWAGLKFHSLIDILFDDFILGRSCADEDHKNHTALKYLQDELLYDKTKSREEAQKALNNILPEELLFAVRPDDVARWHDVLKDYLAQKPDQKSRERAALEIFGQNAKAIERFGISNQRIEIARNDKNTTDKLLYFYDHIEDLLNKPI